MAERNQPQKRNLAEAAFRKNYAALYDALAQPLVITGLAVKLYSAVIITSETRDAILTSGIPPAQQASLLLQAVEASIKSDYKRLRKFIRVLRKQPVLEPIAKQLRLYYSALVSEARHTESSSSGSDTDSTKQHQSQGIDISGNGIPKEPSSQSPQTPPKTVPFETPPVSPVDAKTQPTRKRKAQEPCSEVKQRIAQLEQMYENLVGRTRAVVKQQSPMVDAFRQKITLLPTAVKGEYQKYLKELVPEIYRSETIEEIFGYLNLLWNYLSFGLLRHIIQVYGDEELKQQIEEYSTAVQTFREETSLHAFLSAQPKRRYLRVPADLKCHLKEVMFKHKNLTIDSSLSEVESYRQQLACEYSLPDFAVILEQIEPGSLSTVWLVPASVAATMKECVQRKRFNFLQEHKIIQMEIDGKTVYPSATAEIEISDLEFGDQIREGGTGIVYKGHWKSRGLDVAIKTTGVLEKTEVEHLNSLDHPNIVLFHGAVIKKPNYYIVMELAEHGSLHDYLHEVKFQVDYKQRLKWAMQIAKGMNYLHMMKIMHRDLKPHNVLITKDLTAKICDFGAAKTFEHTTAQTMTGTFRWIAPEVLNEEPYSLQCDVFSFGMMLYELIVCKEPFSDIPTMEAVAKIRNGENPDIPESCETFLSNLLTMCWKKDPKARPTFARVIAILDSKGFHELSKVFLQSLQKMVDSMDETSNAAKKAKSALSSITLQLRDGKTVPLVDPAAYQEARTIPELMKSMSPYWNCLSISFFEAVVNSAGSSASTSALQEFKSARNSSSHLILVAQAATASGDQKALHPLKHHSEKLQSCQPAVFARLAGHQLCASVNVTQISVEVDKAVLHLTDFDHVTEAVVAFLKLPVAALVYCGCSENPLTLFWEVSKHLVGHISSVVPGNERYRQLHQYSITTLVVRDEIKYTCPNMKDVQMWESSSKGHTDKMLDLLKCVAVDVVDFAGRTALVKASWNGQSQAAKVLITEGANVNHQTKDGHTPLSFASTNGHTDVAELLLNNGAKVNLQAEDGGTPLMIASQEGHRETVQLLLSRGANINLQAKTGATPLYMASQEGHSETVQLLLSRGANINLQAKDGSSPLSAAANYGHTDVVELLLRAGANTELQYESGGTPLHWASQEGHVKIVELLLGADANINALKKTGATPLYIASEKGHSETVQLLLSRGANINLQEEDGGTPLMIASQKGHRETVQLLLSRGANINLQSKNGFTPLSVASQNGHSETVQLLLSRGANVNLQSKNGFTPLSVASQNGHSETVQLLLSRGANVNLQSKTGATPLFIAAQNGHTKTGELLINGGGDVNLQRNTGATPLYMASQEGHSETVQLLLSRGANINLQEETGATPLFIAAQNGHTKTGELLINGGGDVNLQRNNGFTPLSVASQNGHSETVQLLLSRGANVNLQEKTGATPLFIAAQNGHTKTGELLINGGGDVNLQRNNGDTPLIIASWKGHPEIVQLLINSGADINTLEKNGWTPLICAAIQGHEEVAELLLTLGANPNILDQNQETAVMWAARKGHVGVVTRLLQHRANIKITNKERETALDIATRAGHTKVCEELRKYY